MNIKQLQLIYLFILFFIFSNVLSDVLPYNNSNQEVRYKKGSSVIGSGHLITAKEWEKYKNGITKEEAIELFKKDLPKYERIVKEHIKAPLTQNEYDALVMRAYNAGSRAFSGNGSATNGSAKIVEYINGGKDLKSEEFAKYYQALNIYNGQYIEVIEKRRIMELDIFQKNDYTEHSDEYYKKRLIYNKPQTNQNQVSSADDEFTTSQPFLYETATRFIVVIGCSGGDIGCSNVTYYEINKQTGKSFKITGGKTINIGPAFSFKGYKFDDQDISYILYLQGVNPALEIIKGENKLILNEPIIEYNLKP